MEAVRKGKVWEKLFCKAWQHMEHFPFENFKIRISVSENYPSPPNRVVEDFTVSFTLTLNFPTIYNYVCACIQYNLSGMLTDLSKYRHS